MKKRLLSIFLSCAMLLTMLPAAASASEAGEENGDAAQTEAKLTLGELSQRIRVESGAVLLENMKNATPEDTLAQLKENFASGFNADGTVDTAVFDYDEHQASAGLNEEHVSYPATFDLRHVGGEVSYDEEAGKNTITGGISYVTPVKLQDPWGTCWAFGTIAAAEISILHELNMGTTTSENNNLDLSEHHLAWFAKNHLPTEGEDGYGVNDVHGQEGEGYWYKEGASRNGSMSTGNMYLATTILASGEGVTTEEKVPYCGTCGMIVADRKDDADVSVYPQSWKSYESIAAWDAEEDAGIRENYYPHFYSASDDWSLDETRRFYQDYALEEGNILPAVAPLYDEETDRRSILNEDGINAVKGELLSGKGVQADFYADTADPSDVASFETSRYINSNYAHYAWDKYEITHCVCIVGWDDNYAASNFGHEHPVLYDNQERIIYQLKENGQVLSYTEDGIGLYYVDEAGETHNYNLNDDKELIEAATAEDGSETVPPGDGAWIVKNSWGAEGEDFPNTGNWGVDGTGYFYISYYDTSVSNLESYDFITTEEEKKEYSYNIIDQYDYMPASTASESEAYAPVMMANVFTASENMLLEGVSCQTTTPGTSVIYSVCLLDEDEAYPDADNTVEAYTNTITYTYGGFHRQQLEEPITISKGQRYAVIVTEFYDTMLSDDTVSRTFCINSNTGYTKDANEDCWLTGVINPGESYLLTAGYNTEKIVGVDYYDYISEFQNNDPRGYTKEYDNFNIKAYGVPVSETMVSGISLDRNHITVIQKETEKLNALVTVEPDNSFNRMVNWITDNPDVATVDAYGNVTGVSPGTVTITAVSRVEPAKTASCEVTVEKKFRDVSDSAYYNDAVCWAYNNGYTAGTSERTFSPESLCKRCDAVVFLWRWCNSPEFVQDAQNPFTDVSEDAYYYKAVLWAYANGFVKGTDTSSFSPDQEITRAEMITILYRILCLAEDKSVEMPFEDVSHNAYYYDPVKWGYAEGIVCGADQNHFEPSAFCTRAQVVAFMKRAQKIVEQNQADS